MVLLCLVSLHLQVALSLLPQRSRESPQIVNLLPQCSRKGGKQAESTHRQATCPEAFAGSQVISYGSEDSSIRPLPNCVLPGIPGPGLTHFQTRRSHQSKVQAQPVSQAAKDWMHTAASVRWLSLAVSFATDFDLA